MATIDAEVAGSCFYKLSRGGKTIEGPSVRLAEIVASAWGNLKFGARIIDEPSVHDYGEDYWTDRSYGAVDPEGHMWWFTQRLRG